MENTAVVPSTLQPAGSGVLARMSPRTRGLLVIGAAALAAIVAAAWLWSASPTYRVLFTNLSDRDGGAVIAQLSQMNIPYRNADGGTVMVPADKVHEAVRAATYGGALALGRESGNDADGERAVGSIAVGHRADLHLLNAPSATHLAYRPGIPLTHAVWRAGVAQPVR